MELLSTQYPALVVIAPLLGAIGVSAAGWLRKELCFPLAVLALGLSVLSAVGMLMEVIATGPILYRLGGWDPPVGIAYNVDSLNALVLSVVSSVALVNLLASRAYVRSTLPDRVGAFYTLYILSVTGLMGMVVTGDAFNLYVLLEIASLAGYALIGLGRSPRGPMSSLNYLFMGTIGASFYLLGVGMLYMVTGTLNMADLAQRLPAIYESRVVLAAFVMIMVGIWTKAAFFPLHFWLPGAYSYSPGPVASLMAPLATKVMIYVMLRMTFTVFTPSYVMDYLNVQDLVVWLAVIAIVAGAVWALAQRELRKMLSYIIVAEVGYMVGGAWLGTPAGFTGAVLHLVNDAVMTLCVFIAAAAIRYKLGGTTFKDLEGLWGRMPWTMAGMAVGALSIIGVPPTCGFFSKWYLLVGAYQAGHWGFMAALIFSSLVAVVLFFRVFELGYFLPWADHEHGHGHGEAAEAVMDEAPVSTLIALGITALGVILLGFYAGDLVKSVVVYTVPAGLM